MHSCILCSIGVNDENKPEALLFMGQGFDIVHSDSSGRLHCKFQWKAATAEVPESDGGDD